MRILIVEDDKNLIKILKEGFKSEGFAVDMATDGEIGLYKAAINEYDAVILDIILPQKDGYMVCKELRESGKTMPILMISVKSDVATKVGFLNFGADDYMTKPFSFEELAARVKAILRRPKQTLSDIIQIGDLFIDDHRHIIKIKSKEIYLARKEFELLKYLARNHGTVVTRAALMEHVWDAEADPFSNTVEMHMVKLRKKLGISKNQLIKTIPGRGYKLQAV